MGKDWAIPESHKAAMLLASIDPKCTLESTAAALRTKDIDELTWDYVATTLIDENKAKESLNLGFGSNNQKVRNVVKRTRKVFQHLVSLTNLERSVTKTHIPTSNPPFVLLLEHSSLESMTALAQIDHIIPIFAKNPDNPNDKLLAKIQKRLSAQVQAAAVVGGSSKSSKEDVKKVGIAGAAVQKVDKTSISPPKDHRSYADSGAICHFFHCDSDFVAGSLVPCEERTVMLADKTSVTATHVGEVILPFYNADVRLKRSTIHTEFGIQHCFHWSIGR